MTGRKFIGLLFLLIASQYDAFSQIGGKRSFEFLEVPNHARVAGLGTVNVSSNAGDVNMVWQNPALLRSQMDGQMSFTFSPYLAGIYSSTATYAKEFEKAGLFSLGVFYVDYGNFEGFDNTGAPTEDFGANDFSIQLSHSRKQGVFQYGASVKFAGSQISGYNQSAVMMDLGGAFLHPEEDLSLGMVIKNVGFYTQKLDGEDRSLPFDVQLGATFKPEFMPFRFSLTANRLYQYDLSYFDYTQLDDDGNNLFTNENDDAPGNLDKIFQHLTIGTEIILGKSINLRAGYNHLIRQSLKGEQAAGGGGFTFGFLFQTKKLNLAYSNAIYQIGGTSHFITLGTNFNHILKKKS
ncbi:type IX secretion system protein PorQ [Marivirga sp. S37H4]|uniref:Type IX secretion system protein PorQ n=1 Tax=Marivirga aurantiaca TaxID=2802615 RepID=A0A934WY90_9BACT|nr:type IX secretion system protein PorQ [Marivirga aurantiaca]MBK6265373.1 type IX secretion system protein PorQ [Marivirga aurantiaca]